MDLFLIIMFIVVVLAVVVFYLREGKAEEKEFSDEPPKFDDAPYKVIRHYWKERKLRRY